MTYEDLSNLTNFPTIEDIPPATSSEHTVLEIFFIIFGILGILGDALIIYTIFKFQKLRTIPYILLANWAIADILLVFVTPTDYELLSIIENKALICIFRSLRWELSNNVMVFIILVSFNWMLESYFTKFYDVVKKFYQMAIALIWFVTLGLISINIKSCLSHRYHLSILLFSTSVICTVFVLVLQITRAVTKFCKKPTENSPLMLNIPTVQLTVTWIIELIYGYMYFQHFFILIAECILLCNSFITLVMLYFFDEEFQACLHQVLKLSPNGYQETSLHFDNPNFRMNSAKSSEEIAFNSHDNTNFEI